MPTPRTALDRHRRSVVLAAAVLAGAWRVSFLDRPVAPDEGGLLLLARQWQPGTSLYGDYFVDRPPGLVAVVWAADAAGGLAGVRVLAVLAVVASVLLADLLGRGATGRPHGGTAAAVAAAVYLSLPLFGVLDLNAEMLACPLVLAGLVLLLRALRAPDGLVWCSVGAGCAGAAALALKQNIADVLVVGLSAVAWLLWSGRRREGTVLLCGLVGGATLVTTALGSLAWSRGTTPGELWDGLVAFRVEALRAIGSASADANSERAWTLLGALLLSGCLVIILGGWVAGRHASLPARERVPVRGLLVPLAAYEVAGVLLGGSYWLHYLLLLTPTIAWSAALMTGQRWARVALGVTLTWAAVVAGSGLAVASQRDLMTPEDRAVVTYLQQHARPGDTATVAFGRPNILAETGLSSPYAQLWSLPVRVLDPRLSQLRRVLRSADAPTWVVTAGRDLSTWGVDAERANQVLRRHYDVSARVEGATIYRRSGIVDP